MKQTDKGVLINRISYSDSSYILTFYTQEKGIQKFIFQGAKKKKVPVFPLLIGELTYYKRPDSELGKLTNLDVQNASNELSFDPIKSVLAYFIADVLGKCLKHEEEDLELFAFIVEYVERIQEMDDLIHVPVHFLTEFSKHLGICPNIHSENSKYFNLMDGELGNIQPIGDVYYQDEVVVTIENSINNNFDRMNSTKSIRQKALEAMIHYFQIHIPQFGNLTTIEIIQDILYS